jgi:hypothetical protein
VNILNSHDPLKLFILPVGWGGASLRCCLLIPLQELQIFWGKKGGLGALERNLT